MACDHDLDERELAVAADGYCPICMGLEMDQMRRSLWKEIDYPALEYAMDGPTIIIGWWSKDAHWQWVCAHWTGEEWDAGDWTIDHCRPTHWINPADLTPPPFSPALTEHLG